MLPGLLLMLPVVVVDVAGDRLDPSHTRELLEKELSVTAIAPDDPRAANATGRIEVSGNAKDGTLTVKYRKLDEPIERTIKLANDPSRAESDAALLAGNLARDEAGELTPSETPAKKEEPPKNAEDRPSVVANREAARDLAQMRAFLTQSVEEEKTARTLNTALTFGLAAAFLAPTIYFFAAENPSDGAKSFRTIGAIEAGLLTGIGIYELIWPTESDNQVLAQKVRAHERGGSDPAWAVDDVEQEWGKRAEDRRSSRRMGGWALTSLGALLVASGTTWALIDGPQGEVSSAVLYPMAIGMFVSIAGISMLASESAVESSHRMWRTVKAPMPDDGPKVSFGAGPLPGGGASASFALRF